jgi:hypothetical protein
VSVISVFATRCETAAAWLFDTFSSGMISVDGVVAPAPLLRGSAMGLTSRPGSRWQPSVNATAAITMSNRMLTPAVGSTRVRARYRADASGPTRAFEARTIPAAEIVRGRPDRRCRSTRRPARFVWTTSRVSSNSKERNSRCLTSPNVRRRVLPPAQGARAITTTAADRVA